MSLDPQFLRLLMETFKTELNEQLQQMTDDLLRLESGVPQAEHPEIINAIFRCAHNIKGAARGVEARAAADLAHQLESMFMELRAGRLALTPQLVDLSLAACDGLREIAQAISTGQEPQGKETLLGDLSDAAAGKVAAPSAAPPAAPSAPARSSGLDPEFLKILRETFRVELAEQLQMMTDGLLKLESGLDEREQPEVLNAIFRSAHNIKGSARGVEALAVADLAHQLESMFMALRSGTLQVAPPLIDLSLAACDGLRDAAQALSEGREPEADPALVARLRNAAEGRGVVPPAATAEFEIFEQASTAPAVPVPKPAPKALPEAIASAEPIKVSPAKLQRVSGLAEDLQLAKIAIGEHFEAMQALAQRMGKLEARLRTVRASLRSDSLHERLMLASEGRAALDEGLPELADLRRMATGLTKALRGTLTRTSQVTNAIQGDIRMMQLVPVANTLRPLVRMVRDVGRELGKPVELEITGDQIEVDRTVLEGLRDPLMHLLRNAIDHGLESPEERLRLGKPEAGVLSVEVSSSGGQIHLIVADDGRGIDAIRIGEAALRKQIVQAEELERMGDQEKLMLIFRPGFSSKDIITDLSGRGVGLDVVVANLRKLKGSVKVFTSVGNGTQFAMELPLTLTMERGLHVRAGGESLLIPSISVDRIAEIGRDEVLEVAASHALLMEGKPVALRDLGSVLGLPSRQLKRDERLPIVAVARGWSRVAFVVDEVVGEREIVIKRLPPPLQAVPNISGATLTGNGEIMMVLNVDELIDNAHRQPGQALADAEAPQLEQRPHILVVDDSITTRTLEKNMLETQGYRVSVGTDGQSGWELLQKDEYALVITDVEMPRMNGFELTEKIRASGRFPQLPIIIVTSLAKESDKRRGVEAGADAYLVKSDFESRALLDIVRQLL